MKHPLENVFDMETEFDNKEMTEYTDPSQLVPT